MTVPFGTSAMAPASVSSGLAPGNRARSSDAMLHAGHGRPAALGLLRT